ncbi:MAG: hypothetical protein J6Y77_05110 [Paludibacteraceae bacterium]|nr:hypothetical protein [Paludibacteraceae bacterium]
MASRKSNKKSKRLSQRLLHWGIGLSTLAVAVLLAMFALLHYGLMQTMAYYAGKCSLPTSEIVGIDVSHHQGKIAWDSVCFNYNSRRILSAQLDTSHLRRRVDFAYAKATEGETMHDWRYEYNRQGIRQNKIRFGAYHFYSYQADPAKQAENFIAYAGLQSGDLPPVLDIEGEPAQTPDQLRRSVKIWLTAVEKHYGCKPLIYTYHKFYKDYFEKQPDFADYLFWIARYPYKPSVAYQFWQCSDRGRIIGCPLHAVDINVFNGNREAFNQLQVP